MQIKTSAIEVDGTPTTRVEVIDPSDLAVAHSIDLSYGEQVVLTVPAAPDPGAIEVGEVEGIPVVVDEAPEAEQPGNPDGEGQAAGSDGEQPEGEPASEAGDPPAEPEGD